MGECVLIKAEKQAWPRSPFKTP